VVALLACACACGCGRETEPTKGAPSGGPSATSAVDATIEAATEAADASDDIAVDGVVDASDAAAQPTLLESDGAPLPQTDAFPSTETGSFRARIDLLWEGIVRDDPQVAERAFFPLVAYQQVKAIPNPAADFKSRLLGAFARDVHKYHQQLGDVAAAARFVRIDVPTAKAKWMELGSEGNKLGYDRVLDSTIVFVDGAGKERTLGVKSMISWRGEWYVVHLGGFK
jgi:hypothetical protein